MDISISIVRGLAARLKRRGIDVERFCADAGLPPAAFSSPIVRLSGSDLARAVEAAIHLSGDPALGLRVGQVTPASHLPLVGSLLVNCRTMRDAIEINERFSLLVRPEATWELTEQADTASYSYQQNNVEGAASRFRVEFAMALTISFAEHFVGRNHAPIEVHFQHAAPLHVAVYESVFQCPIVFEAARNELIFDRKLLDEVAMLSDELVWRTLMQRAENMLAEQRSTWGLPDRVKSALYYGANLGDADTNDVARRLGLTSRSLRRRLAEEGRPLSTLIAEVKCELACVRLRDPDSCIKKLAGDLGFSEPSAFHRAFKRWMGVTPAQYRHGDDGNNEVDPVFWTGG